MLIALRIRDLAVIESLELEFEPGFTVLTGETGAGKSILVDALTLVLGGRASADLIRSGAESAEVEALFSLEKAAGAKEYLAASGLLEPTAEEAERGSDEIIIRRLISRSGRNRVWLNGKLESQNRLFELGRFLVDIYGQHEYQTLLRPDRHQALLDSFGGLTEPLAAYREAYGNRRRLLEELRALDLDEAAKREREDLLRWRVQEIEAAQLKPGEDEQLAAERERLKHADVLTGAGSFGLEYLYDSDRSAVAGLRELEKRFRQAAEYDPWFAGPLAQIEQAATILEEAAHELRQHTEGIEADPSRLATVEDRLDAIKRLKRKYGETIAAILAHLAEAREELGRLAHQEERLKELTAAVADAEKRARALADALRKARLAAGAELSRQVETELGGLGMAKARFEVRVTAAGGGEGNLGPAGADETAFYLSPNPGEELKPLVKIASGGELSRIMLALRARLSAEGDVATLVFDEVDQGIGGAVAEAVGKRMVKLASSHQVLCVTHHPQIAALVNSHLQVLKHQAKNRTWVEVKRLGAEGRIEELSRMVAGAEITDTARAHAREMLSLAEQERGKAASAKASAKFGRETKRKTN